MGQGLRTRIEWFHVFYGTRCTLPLQNHIDIIEKRILPSVRPDLEEETLERTIDLLARWPKRDSELLAMLAVSSIYNDARSDVMSSRSYLGRCLADLRAHANTIFRSEGEELLAYRELVALYTVPPAQPLGDGDLSL